MTANLKPVFSGYVDQFGKWWATWEEYEEIDFRKRAVPAIFNRIYGVSDQISRLSTPTLRAILKELKINV